MTLTSYWTGSQRLPVDLSGFVARRHDLSFASRARRAAGCTAHLTFRYLDGITASFESSGVLLVRLCDLAIVVTGRRRR
jgi:hypothetical protein